MATTPPPLRHALSLECVLHTCGLHPHHGSVLIVDGVVSRLPAKPWGFPRSFYETPALTS